MKDLFESEQRVLELATQYAKENAANKACGIQEFEALTREYGRILKLLRRLTKVSDMTAVELNSAKIRLLNKVHIDGLTGIYNRRYFDEELRAAHTACAENQSGLGVLMLDVDFFKQYNDTYGHTVGDDCLRQLATELQDEAEGNSGTAVRYGGEEFAVILREANPAALQRVADEILEKVRLLQIPHEKNTGGKPVTISIGGYCENAAENADCESFVRYADTALYQSKQAGRDRFTLYHQEG